MFSRTEIVRFLIENEASLDIQDNDGTTALHVTAFFGIPKPSYCFWPRASSVVYGTKMD